MSDDQIIEGVGVVEECLPSAKFRVLLKEFGGAELGEENQRTVLSTISGRMRKNRVRILPGDTVRLEISLYDLDKGRIVFREKS